MTKQCTWEPTFQGLQIINQYKITDTQSVSLSGAKFVTFAPGTHGSSMCDGEVYVETTSNINIIYTQRRLDTDDDFRTESSTIVALYPYLNRCSPSGIITFDRYGMFLMSYSSNYLTYANGYGDPSKFSIGVRYMNQFYITIYG